MAKNIKAIKCPHCGSIQKTEIYKHFYRCNSCQTEYFLDDNDVNININHNHRGSASPVPQPANARKVVVGAVVVAVLFLLMTVFSLFNKTSTTSAIGTEREKNEFSYSENYVYTNTATGKAVLLRMGREQLVGKDRSYDFVNAHAIYIDPISKAQLKDQVLFKRIRRLAGYTSNFEELSNGDVYMQYNEQSYFKLNRENNTLVDVTNTLLQKHPEASSGIAKLGMYGQYWDLLTNDGKKFYYWPLSDKLFTEYKDIEAEKEATAPRVTFGISNDDRLMKFDRTSGSLVEKDMDPGRKYFDPEIILQGNDYLILRVNTTAAPQSPTHLQSIDVNTGKVLWTTQASTAWYRSAAKCQEGYAVCYNYGEDMDYISGVLIISPNGRVLYDYQIKRGE